MRKFIVIALLALACSKGDPSKPTSVAGEKLFALRGTLVSREPADNTIMLDHEAIPGYMGAMKMDYSVRGVTVDKLPPDRTKVTAKLHVTEMAAWLTDIKPQ